ncbi:MAG: universal stress protein [Sphingomonadaceae bacterium]
MKRLLVACDGSDPARAPARMAAYIARRTGAEVTVLTVGKIPPVTAGVSGFFVPLVDEEDFLPIVQEGADLVRGLGLEPDRPVALGTPPRRSSICPAPKVTIWW